jgi:hypothetical protein
MKPMTEEELAYERALLWFNATYTTPLAEIEARFEGARVKADSHPEITALDKATKKQLKKSLNEAM